MRTKPETPNADDPWCSNFCSKGVIDCYCAVGYPYEKMCPDCREGRGPYDIFSYCICESSSDRIPEIGITYNAHGPGKAGPYCCISKLTEPLIVTRDVAPDTLKILFDEQKGKVESAQRETYVRVKALPITLQGEIEKCLARRIAGDGILSKPVSHF